MSDTEAVDEGIDDFAQILLERARLRTGIMKGTLGTAVLQPSKATADNVSQLQTPAVPLREVQPTNILIDLDECTDEEPVSKVEDPVILPSSNKVERRSRLKSLARRINEWEDDMTHYVPPASRFNVSPPKNSPRGLRPSTPLSLPASSSCSPTKQGNANSSTSPKQVRFDLVTQPQLMSPSPKKHIIGVATLPCEVQKPIGGQLSSERPGQGSPSKVTTSAPASKVTTSASASKVTTSAPASKVTTSAPASKVTTSGPASKVTTSGPVPRPNNGKPPSQFNVPRSAVPKNENVKGTKIELNTTLAGSSSLSVAERAKLFEQNANGNVPKPFKAPSVPGRRVFGGKNPGIPDANPSSSNVKSRRISVAIPRGKVESSRRLFEEGLNSPSQVEEEDEEMGEGEYEENSAIGQFSAIEVPSASTTASDTDIGADSSPPPSFIPPPPEQIHQGQDQDQDESISFSALASQDNTLEDQRIHSTVEDHGIDRTVTVEHEAKAMPMPDQDISPIRNRRRSKSRSRSTSPRKGPKCTTPKRAASPDKKNYPGSGDVKRIKVNDPKPGHMYPSLTDIEATTEAETEAETEVEAKSEMEEGEESVSSSAESSFGTQIQRMAKANILEAEAHHHFATPEPIGSEKNSGRTPRRAHYRPTEEFSASLVCREIDAMIDYALDGQSFSTDTIMEEDLPCHGADSPGDSPGDEEPHVTVRSPNNQVKGQGQPYRDTTERSILNRASLSRSPSFLIPRFCCAVDLNSPDEDSSPLESSSPLYPRQRDRHADYGHQPSTPLMHSVSFFRKQEEQLYVTPKKIMATETQASAATPEPELRELTSTPQLTRVQTVNDNIKKLDEELDAQVRSIAQVSKALNLCKSTIEFSDSTENVECEKVLLLACQKRTAILNEMTRLRTEGALFQQGSFTASKNDLGPSCQGNLSIGGIGVELKDEFIRSKILNGDNVYHFLLLFKERSQVEASSIVSIGKAHNNSKVLDSNNCLHFPNIFTLEKLNPDFKAELEVFVLQTQAEFLPHDTKYHISKKQKESRTMTPKKKEGSKFSRAVQQSPAGPDAVRSPNFVICGRLTINISTLGRRSGGRSWNLDGVRLDAPVEGCVSFKLQCSAEGGEEKTGFLTLFDDISGLGAWHRRWAKLSANHLSFWMYPEDEQAGKFPMDQIALRHCVTTRVCPVHRDVCARANTLLLVTTREAYATDKNSLIASCHGNRTAIRHLLSADMREERDEWCAHLNRALANLRAWDPQAASPDDTFF